MLLNLQFSEQPVDVGLLKGPAGFWAAEPDSRYLCFQLQDAFLCSFTARTEQNCTESSAVPECSLVWRESSSFYRDPIRFTAAGNRDRCDQNSLLDHQTFQLVFPDTFVRFPQMERTSSSSPFLRVETKKGASSHSPAVSPEDLQTSNCLIVL